MCFVIEMDSTKGHSRECRDPPRSKAKTATENRKKDGTVHKILLLH